MILIYKMKDIASKKHTIFAFIAAFVLIVLLWINASNAEETEPISFAQVEALKDQAQSEDAEILSPENFSAGLKAFQRAKQDSATGKSTERVQHQLGQALKLFEQAVLTVNEIRTAFPDLLSAYNSSIEAGANVRAPKTQAKAEKLFDKILKNVENGKIAEAEERVKETTELFRQAELEAIQLEMLKPAYDLLEKAEAENCPKYVPGMFAEAQKTIAKVEEYIENNRYDRETSAEMAQEAKESLIHTIYVSEWISQLRDKPSSWEDLIQQFEWYIEDVSSSLYLRPNFNRNLSLAVEAILTAIRSLQDDRRHLQEELVARDETIGRLEAEIATLRGQSGKYIAELEQKRRQIIDKQRFEEKISRVTSVLTEEEGVIIRSSSGEKDQIIIRLTSLNFKSGSAELRPENFALLTRVQQVIREFPERNIEVQGHTDAKGDERNNISLSKKRAQAVLNYLLLNMNLPEERITANGYGESRPIANNETALGRTLNRRIEIILE